jgi:hypothetical protein
MDIPALKTDEEAQKVPVTVASSVSESSDSSSVKPTVKSADVPSAADDRNKVIADLINTKKYNLNIKEKHTTPIITFGFAKTRDRKTRKNTKKSQKTTVKKENGKKTESAKAKRIKLAVIGLLWVGAYMALDMGLIDIGWRPPFTIIGPL